MTFTGLSCRYVGTDDAKVVLVEYLIHGTDPERFGWHCTTCGKRSPAIDVVGRDTAFAVMWEHYMAEHDE